LTEIVVEFKKFPFQKEVEPNRLIFELQPREMIHIKLLNRYGQSSKLHEIATSDSISYRGEDSLPEHATLLLDVLKDEKLHFISFPEILASWKITDRILRFLRQHQVPVHEYPPGDPCPPGSETIFCKKSEGWFEMGADTFIS
jgi:Glucose-6-phosphate 1-dehydrogenase